jgi:hypothetical protein
MQPPPKESRTGKEARAIKPTRSEEIRHVIEEYANDLREFIKKLRHKMN